MTAVKITLQSRNPMIREFAKRIRAGVSHAMPVVAEAMLSMTHEGFTTKRDPWGDKWKPLSDTTLQLYGAKPRTPGQRTHITRKPRGPKMKATALGRRTRSVPKRKLGLKGKRRFFVRPNPQPSILTNAGMLRMSCHAKSDATHAWVTAGGPASDYAAVHQLGNPRNRLPNTPKGRPAPIPARPFMAMRKAGGGVVTDLPATWRKEIIETIRDAIRMGV